MQDTNGYKLQMFCAEFIPNLLIYAVMAILALLSKIPFVGILFAVITVIVQLVYTLLHRCSSVLYTQVSMNMQRLR